MIVYRVLEFVEQAATAALLSVVMVCIALTIVMPFAMLALAVFG